MNVVIVHYHLRRGGVTRVVEGACAALARFGIEPLVLSGEPYGGGSLRRVEVVPELAYHGAGAAPDPAGLADLLANAARRRLGAEPDLWHVHNHSLGKNPAITAALALMQGRGARLLLQVHDFAEDGRPANYRRIREFYNLSGSAMRRELYPDSPYTHYAVLNRRDGQILREAGCDPRRLHLLPNPVTAPPVTDGAQSLPERLRGVRVWAYPTRGIRRKNIGELLLLASCCGAGHHFVTTLAPENPEWTAIHERWAALASGLSLPVTLGAVGAGLCSFGSLLARADAMVTTSVAEGFGLAFLEPWLIGKPVAGRNLPGITDDFAGEGIDLGHLYDKLPVPLDLVNEAELLAELQAAIAEACHQYAREPQAGAARRALDAARAGDSIDFGRLSESFQEKVIRQAARGGIGPDIADAVAALPDSDTISRNRGLVAQAYSPDHYGERLRAVYEQVAASPSGRPGHLDADRVLDAFLQPERFNLLRS